MSPTNVRLIDPQPLPDTQREVMFLAEHGPLHTVKRIKPQLKALLRKGMLDDQLQITDLGHAQLAYEHALDAPRPWSSAASILGNDFYKQAHTGTPYQANGYGKQSFIGSVSGDGRTAYVVQRTVNPGAKDAPRVVAIEVRTIPAEFREFFGLKALGGAS